MTNRSPLSDKLATKSIRLLRWRRSVETATRIALPCIAVLFVALLFQGLGVLPAVTVTVTAVLSAAAVMAGFVAGHMSKPTPDQALLVLGQNHGLADAALSALELDRRLSSEGDPMSAAFIRAHIRQTHRKLEAVPATKFFPAQLMDRLQVIAVLGLCVLSTALL